MPIIAAWLVAMVITAIGIVWLFFNYLDRPLLEAEVKGMREAFQALLTRLREGDGDDEVNLMNIRVADSEADLSANQRARPKAITVLVIGLLMLAALALQKFS